MYAIADGLALHAMLEPDRLSKRRSPVCSFSISNLFYLTEAKGMCSFFSL